jgi:colanic acid biosynthesis glycosyl transferase WcaI
MVCPTFHPEPIGTPLYATDLARWFVKHGWEVRVVTAQPFYPAFGLYPGYGRHRRHDALDDIEILRLPTIVPRGGRVAWRAVNELNFAVQGLLRAPLSRADAVLTITPGVPWAALVGRGLRRRGGRHVVLVHDIQSGLAAALGMGAGKLGGLIRTSERLSLQRCDKIAVLTKEMGEAVAELGVTRPIDVAPLWATVRAPEGLDQQLDRSVQYSGNFGQKQGVVMLVDLAEALDGDDVHLTLRGAGRRYDAIRERVAERGLQERVTFEAPVAAEELAGALARSPVHVVLQAPGSGAYVMPSKVVNALTCGAVVVAMAEPGSPLTRLAEEVQGIEVVAVGDVAAMADRIRTALADPELPARRRSIAADAEVRFSREEWLGHLAEFLERRRSPVGADPEGRFSWLDRRRARREQDRSAATR